MALYSFTGHETFACRQFWLKKGYDFILDGKSFTSPDAVADLGVGKNMVNSIKHWVQAFGLVDQDGKTTKIADAIFHPETGRDPFLEDLSSLWLLHYHLLNSYKASLYEIIFQDIAPRQVQFDDVLIRKVVGRKLLEASQSSVADVTLKADIGVFRRLYIRPDTTEGSLKGIEDELSSLLVDLDLVQLHLVGKKKGTIRFSVEPSERPQLPAALILYVLKENFGDQLSVNFEELYSHNGPGKIFALSKEGMYQKIQVMSSYPLGIQYSSDGGIQQLTFRNKLRDLTHDEIFDLIYE